MRRARWYVPRYGRAEDAPGTLVLGVEVREVGPCLGDPPSLYFTVRAAWTEADGGFAWWAGSPVGYLRVQAWYGPDRYRDGNPCRWMLGELEAEEPTGSFKLAELDDAAMFLRFLRSRLRRMSTDLGDADDLPGFVSRVAKVLKIDRIALASQVVRSGYGDQHPERCGIAEGLAVSPFRTGGLLVGIEDARGYLRRYVGRWATARGMTEVPA